MNTRRIIRNIGVTVLGAMVALGSAPVAAAAPGWAPPAPVDSGAITGAGFGPTLGVGGPSSYSGGSTSNHFCAVPCGAATLGVGGPSSYTGGSTANSRGGGATLGVGDVDNYTGGATGGTTHNGTNATDRTGNYGPGHP